MNIFIIYLLIVPTIILLSEASIQNIHLHQIADALDSMALDDEITNCDTDDNCVKIRKCIQGECRNPCSGSCGIDAYCNVINHNVSCSCFQCYKGDPNVECTPLTGLKGLRCQFMQIINRLGGT